MKIKLIDHKVDTKEAHWGTCELCEFTGPFDFTELKFQADDGTEPYWVDAWYYEEWYGPCGYEIDNLYNFAHWLSEQEFSPRFEITTANLSGLLSAYYREREYHHDFAEQEVVS